MIWCIDRPSTWCTAATSKILIGEPCNVMLHSSPFKCIFMYLRITRETSAYKSNDVNKIVWWVFIVESYNKFLGMLLSVCLIATCQVPNSSDYAFLILSLVHGWLHWLLDYECTHPLIYFWSIWCIIHVRLLARVWWKGKRLSFKADSGAVASSDIFYCMKSLYCTGVVTHDYVCIYSPI